MPEVTLYLKVCKATTPCRTMRELQNVWYKHQPDLAAMDQVARAWLVAMKEFYKGMIKRGDIDTYLSIRNATAAKNQVSKPPDQDDGRVV